MNLLVILFVNFTLAEYQEFVKHPERCSIYPQELQNLQIKVEPGNPKIIGGIKFTVPIDIFNWSCIRRKMNFKIFHDAGVDISHAQVWAVFAKPEFWYPAAIIELTTNPGKSFTFDVDISNYNMTDLKKGSAIMHSLQNEGNLSAYHAHFTGLDPDNQSKLVLGVIDSIATVFVNEMWSTILSALDAVVAGAGATIDQITDMSIKTTCNWGRFPTLNNTPFRSLGLWTENHPLIYDLWVGKDTIKVSIPGMGLRLPVPITFLLQAPEALLLYLITPTVTQEAIGIPVGLDGIECMRLSGGQYATHIWQRLQSVIGDSIHSGDTVLDSYLNGSILQLAKLYTNGCWGLAFPTTAYQLTSSDWQSTANTAIKATYLYFNLCYMFNDLDTVNVPGLGPIPIPHGWIRFAKHKQDYNLQRYYPRFTTKPLGGCVKIGQILPSWEMIPPAPENSNVITAKDLSNVGYVLWIKYNCKTTLYLKVKLSFLPEDSTKTGGLK